jgi:hypothetical protein
MALAHKAILAPWLWSKPFVKAICQSHLVKAKANGFDQSHFDILAPKWLGI